MTNYEQSLLDELEDARSAVKLDKRVQKTLLTVLVTSGAAAIGWLVFLSFMSSMGENWGNSSGWPAVLLFIVFIADGIATCIYFFDFRGSREGQSPPEILRRAERKYRDYLNRKAEDDS